ncbi:GRIP and coiled-coil domain-containing protein 2 isoform X3 [Eurosta solidaginis]|uniref:GRIP and coiled-coil domain-containing protein 2 isoform X3 n=1 Tax=Eurosta solidaginis TaxID=178769 RepID=UPI0035306C11
MHSLKSRTILDFLRELGLDEAQLETERYEKGLLEVQIKQNEDKIKKLNQDHKKLQQTIQDLKNDILTQNTENSTTPNKDSEQMKRRLCREVAQKEAEIAKLNEVLGNLMEEKSLVQEKLRFAEKQILVCMDRITELDFKVDELTADVEQKDYTIKCLTESKHELEQFINETRSTGNNNSRSDYLDASFSPVTDASGSSTSPENLARSVVDVQLREKEHENAELREELHALKNSNKRLTDLIRKFTIKHAQEYNIATSMSSITAKEEENMEITPGDCLDHLVDYVERIGLLYKDEKERVKTLQAELQAKHRRNDELGRRLGDFEKEIIILKEQVKHMDHANVDLEKEKKRMQEKMARCEQELVKINEQKFELVAKLESLANDYDTHKHKCATQRLEHTTQIKRLENEITGHEQCNSALTNENKTLNDEVLTLQTKLQTLQQAMLANSDEMRTLNERIKGYQNELEAHDKTEKMLKEKYEKILVQHEATKRDRRETADHLEAMRNKIAVKEFEMTKLGTEIIEVRKKNAELETRIDTLTTEFKTEKHNAELAINTRDERIKEISEERDRIEEILTKLRTEHDSMQTVLKESKAELEAALKTFDALRLLLCNEQTESPVNLAERLADVVLNVKRLQQEKIELHSKLELVSSNHTETVSKMEIMEVEMKNLIQAKEDLEANYKTLFDQSELKLNNAEAQIKIYEEDVGNLKAALKQVTEEMQNTLQVNTEEHTVRIMELEVEHENVVKTLKEQLNATKEELCVKERDLQTLLKESNAVKRKLNESVKRLEAVQNEHEQVREASAEKLKSLEDQLQNVVNENKNLLNDIDTYKAEHAKINEKVEKADKALNELNAQLTQEANSKSDLSNKLQSSETRLFETEQKLESILNEKSHTISGLKTAYESQTAVLKRSEDQVNTLEREKLKQIQQIATLQENLQKANDEKERLSKDVTSFQTQIQREQEEKSTLLASLEQTADQLKLAICEKDQQSKVLEKNCAELNTQIRQAKELSAKLQTDISTKDAELQRLQEEQDYERDNWQTKLSEMTRMLAAQSLERENLDTKLQQINTVIENHINLSREQQMDKIDLDEIIKLPESNKDTQLSKLRCALKRLLYSISQLHAQLDQTEQKRQGAVEVLEKANDKLNTQLLKRNAEIIELQQQLLGERKHNAVTEHLRKELNSLKDIKDKYETQIQQLEHNCTVAKEQYQHSTMSIQRLEQEKRELKSELQRSNDNVTSLIQGSDTLREEKKSLVDQLQKLRQQLTQTCEQHSSTESMVKNILQNSKTLERKLDQTENELKLLRTQLEMLERKKDEMATENKKLNEMQEVKEKRIEKLSVKTGDLLARCSKLEHENNKVNELLSAAKEVTEKLQREKSTLEKDKLTLQERITNTERNQQQLINKVYQLEQMKATYDTEKKQLEAAEADAKSKLTKLEKIRQSNEEKIRKLNYSLETTEANNVRLNHEIGAINSQLNELKNAISAERTAELEKAIHERDRALARVNELETLAEKLQLNVEQLQEHNSNINDQLSKITCSLQISQEKCETLAQQLRDLGMDLCALKEEKAQIENQHINTCAKLKELEIKSDNLRSENEERILTLEAQLEQLHKELDIKSEEIALLRCERDKLRNGNEEDDEEMQQLRKRLSVAEALAETEQRANAQLRVDNQILQAKYRESKQRLQEETQMSEDRIKDNRLEMEGKLEKMKNKMKTLYTEEVTKMKGKQERELTSLRAEMEVLKAQNTKYEQHVNKLSMQIMRTNDRVLEYQKQIAIQNTKLKQLQDCGMVDSRFKRSSLATNSLPRSLSSAVPNAAATSSNLAMEDEEGEVFNNTYLTDLQTGRMSMCRDVCAEELQYRNSLLPPHLKSTYAAQYDHGLAEDELKDGPHSLDDSMSALLSTTAGGRKKLTGITNYKRPGPPTPSKHGGRLSLGSSEPPREILKEANDHTCSTKTPVRFGFFASKFSMGNSNTRDESAKLPRDLLKAVQKKNFETMYLKSPEAICTSTPRKSKSHYDRRCLFNQLMSLSGTSRLSLTVERQTPKPPSTLSLADISAIHHEQHASTQSHLKMLEQQRIARKRRSSLLRLQIGHRLRRSPISSETTPSTVGTPVRIEKDSPITMDAGVRRYSITDSTTTGTTSATATTTTTASSSDAYGRRSSGFGCGGGRSRQRRHKRDRGPRLSLYASGSSHRTPNRIKLREQLRKKAHKQRRENYNRGRDIDTEQQRLKAGCQDIDSPRISEANNTGRTFRLNATIVLAQNSEYPEDYDIPEYTSNYFSDLITGTTTTAIIEETSGECQTLSPTTKSHEFTDISEDYAYNSNDTQLTLNEKTKQNIKVDDEKSEIDTANISDESNESSTTSQNDSITLPVEQSLKNEAADEPSTVDELEIFDARHKCFEKLAAETVSAAPFAVTNVAFDVISTPTSPNQAEFVRLERLEEQQRHSITYTLMTNKHELVTRLKPSNTTISSPILFVKTFNANDQIYNYDDNETKITLADVLHIWSSIWMRLDQQLQLTIVLAVFGPLIALLYLTLSQYT